MRFARLIIIMTALFVIISAGHAFARRIGDIEQPITDLYVSQAGSIDNTAGIDDPLPTLDLARERLRNIPGDHTITVWIQGGTYHISQPITFTKADRDNVVYRALPGQRAILDAGLPITGFGSTVIDGVTVWAVAVPELASKSSSSNANPILALYDDEGALPLNRYPQSGYLKADRAELRDAASKLRYGSEGEVSNVNSFRAFYAGEDLTRSTFNPAALTDMNNVLVRILHLWKDEMAYLKAYNPETGKITLSRPTSLTVWKGDQYYFENVREGLSAPGSWYLERNTGVLFVVPKPDWDISTLTLYAGVTERIMTLSGVSNITFKRIEFTHTGWSVPGGADFPQAAYDVECAVFASNCSSLMFEDCTFRDLGGTALKLHQGVTDSRVTRSTFERIGANGIFIHGINERSSPKRNERLELTDNDIHNYGVNYHNAVGILLVHASQSSISHNTIHDGAYTAISVGWVWGSGYNATRDVIIADNDIYNIGNGNLSDMGGIYLLGRQPGTVVSGNVIHDVRFAQNDGYGGWGIYLDEGSSEITIINNLVYNCASQGLFVFIGSGNTAISNIFANNKRGQVSVSKQQIEVGVTLEGNILYGSGKSMFADTPSGRIQQSGANVYWDPNTREQLRTLLGEFGFIETAVVKNPKLTNPSANDFTPALDSQAFEAGFIPYDWSGVGVRE
ncbi:hypothetical protein FACS1894184_01890 [Clostridia bacterium]|nr:hypothetical protein FACS1894184_01890 [Clostridia bacterium]